MSQPAVEPETMLRPLLLATIGSGVMTLGLLQFGAGLLGQLEVADRAALVHGIRSSFFAFLGSSAALFSAYLLRVYRSAALSGWFNAYGAACFLAAVLVAGGHIGAALHRLSGFQGMPVAVGGFFLFSMVGLALLFAAALLFTLRPRLGRRATIERRGHNEDER